MCLFYDPEEDEYDGCRTPADYVDPEEYYNPDNYYDVDCYYDSDEWWP